MDKTKDYKIPKYGTRQVSHADNLVVGAKQLKKAVVAGRAKQVFLAENADPAITGPIEALCVQRGIPVSWVSSMSELGRACGIEVGAAAAAVVDKA